jgi:pyridoxal phosphate enzyme (YggS family)
LMESDFEALYAVASDPAIWEQHPNKGRWKKEVFREFFDGAIQSKGAFKIVDKATGNILGSTRFYEYNEADNSLFVGYTFFATSCWGKGYNPSVKDTMLDYIFQFVSKVYLQVGKNNIRSQIAVGRLGAIQLMEKLVNSDASSTQDYMYVIHKDQWVDRRSLINNISAIKDRIINACIANGRNPDAVQLLLATKTVPAERISVLLRAGHTLIAENRVQELKEKFDALKDIPHTNHFIGHLQTNKINDILKCQVACLHSLDRISLARQLHLRLEREQKTLQVLIQVNTSGEDSKFGVDPENAIELVRQVTALKTLKIKGLMTIGLFSADSEKVRQCFRMLKNIQQQIKDLNIPGVTMQELSMGMSGDLEIAIAEGATIVRVGTAIFGKRPTPDNFYWDEKNTSMES